MIFSYLVQCETHSKISYNFLDSLAFLESLKSLLETIILMKPEVKS